MSQSALPSSYTSGCAPYNPEYATPYGYIPSEAAGVTFCTIFGSIIFLTGCQAFYQRHYWVSVFLVGTIVEVLGWAGRLWSSKCPYADTPFLMQISTLIIAPTFFTAGIYIILGRLIRIFGRHTSPISPNAYLGIFCTCDIISLVVQAVGGGMASDAFQTAGGDTTPGTNVMVAGIVFQMASVTVFCALAAVFLVRASVRRFPRSLQMLIAATTLSTVAIYIRCIYRTIELAQGWSGYLVTHQTFFIVLDGVMMVLAVAVFIIFSPGTILTNYTQDCADSSMNLIPEES